MTGETPPPSGYRPFPNKAGDPPPSDYLEDDLRGPVYGTSEYTGWSDEHVDLGEGDGR